MPVQTNLLLTLFLDDPVVDIVYNVRFNIGDVKYVFSLSEISLKKEISTKIIVSCKL